MMPSIPAAAGDRPSGPPRLGFQFVPWLLIPRIPILLAVLCWNLLGDGLRDAFDPKKRR
ncbi:MAG TPA: hypothetical protein PLU66_09555 [Trueperaceae bacterium]|nr:hypothetical protein [Trueperaceae bacterium]